MKDSSLTGNELADGAITRAKVADGSLSGVDIDQSSLASVRASNVIGVAMNSDCSAAVPFPSGVSATSEGSSCLVTFASNVLNCTATATVGYRTDNLIAGAERTVQTLRRPSIPNQIYTVPFGGASALALPVDLTLVC